MDKAFSTSKKAANGFTEATEKIGSAAQAAGKAAEKGSIGIGKFGASILRIVKYRAVRAIIRNITSAFSEGLQNVREYSAGLTGEGHRIAEAFDNMSTHSLTMKNQLGSAFAEILTSILPIIEKIVAVLTRAANIISQFFAALGGNAKYYKAVDATKEVADNLGSGAKKAKEIRNTLLGFDVINRLDAPNEPSSGGGGGASDSSNNMFEYTEVGDRIKKIAQVIRDNMPAIEAAVGGFLLGLGALFFFTGANIPLGLGLMVAGAVALGHSATLNWDSVSPKVAEAIAKIGLIVGASLMVIGAILTFSGANMPLGIGLMAAGVASMAAAAVAWGKLPAELKQSIAEIALIVGASFLVLGFIFLLTGNIPLGLGMMLAGGALAGLAVHFGGNELLDKLKDIWKGIKQWWQTNIAVIFTVEYWKAKIDNIIENGILGSLRHGLEDAANTFVSFMERIAGFGGGFNLELDYNGGMIVPQYATGGIPEDGLFMANHGELVGQFANGQTAVANNGQIIEGIRKGVYDAVSAAMSNSGGQQDVRVYLDGKQITNAVTRNQRNADRAMGAVYA